MFRTTVLGTFGLVAACSAVDSLGRDQAALTDAQCDNFAVDGKVQICHATGSATSPYRIIKVSENACVAGHTVHPGDYIAIDDPTCQGLGCLPDDAPCDASLPCCEGSVCGAGGTCVPAIDPGDGCPSGTIGRSFAADGLSFTYIFDAFVASSGPGVDAAQSTKDCHVAFTFEVPFGHTWSMSWDHRGYVQLPAGVGAEQSARYAQGTATVDGGLSDFSGPVANDYLSRDVVDELDFGNGMCDGGTFTVDADAQVRLLFDLTQPAQITTDSIDGKVEITECGGT
jgi:hypothetical protein